MSRRVTADVRGRGSHEPRSSPRLRKCWEADGGIYDKGSKRTDREIQPSKGVRASFPDEVTLEVRLEGEGVHGAREEGRAFQVEKKEQAKALWLDGA